MDPSIMQSNIYILSPIACGYRIVCLGQFPFLVALFSFPPCELLFLDVLVLPSFWLLFFNSHISRFSFGHSLFALYFTSSFSIGSDFSIYYVPVHDIYPEYYRTFRKSNPILSNTINALVMSKKHVLVENDETYMMSITRGTNYDFESVEAQSQHPSSKNVEALSTKKKLKIGLFSVSLWNKAFLIACVIAVSLDPLFFYVPVINEKEKCIEIDKKLRTIALILRFLTDITLIVHIIYQICEAIMAAYKVHTKEKSELELDWSYSKISISEIIPFAKLVAGKLAWRSTLTDILAVFPIPQFLVVFVFFKMRGHGYLERIKILNVFLLGQYLPRIYRIYLSSKELRQTTGIWAKALFNFFLYILASHVVGAFWYFFSIQRETSCWHEACHNSTDVEGCMSTFYCDARNSTARNETFFNQFCLMNVERNATEPFDYGIFLNSLKTGNTGHIHFATKLSYSFWWGLRNLSNFGTNLETSTYVWESCFAVFISVTGLLLFLYLIGNVQTFMSMEAQRWEEIRHKMLLKEKDIERWMDKNELPDDMKKEIKKNIKQKLEENKDADLENLFNILPWHTKKYLKRVLCMNTLNKVPKLERMDEKVLKMICDYLKPVMYAEGTMVFHMGDPLDKMLFITEGTILTYKTTSTDSHVAAENAKIGPSSNPSIGTLANGDFYGEQLLHWASQKNVNLKEVPCSGDNVKCHTKVEGFVLRAKDLKTVVSKCEYWWKLSVSNPRLRVGGVPQTTPIVRTVQPKPGVDLQY